MADYDDNDYDGQEDNDSVLMESGRKGSSENGKGPQLKTPFQKKSLEASFQDNQYPSEDARGDLADEIGLTVNQVNVWFTHRRRKHKKDEALAIVRGEMAANKDGGATKAKVGGSSSSKPTSAKKGRPPARVTIVKRGGGGGGGGDDDESEATEDEEDVTAAVAAAERAEIIKLAKARLKVEVRPDGPTMGFDFDELPSVLPVKTGKRKRVQTRGGQMLEDGTVVPSSGKRSRNSSKKQQQVQERLRKRQEEEEVRRSKLLKEQERRARKEQERAIQLQQKLEQAMRKEAERKEKERQRERERLEREQAKEELRRQKEEDRLRKDEERERQKELLAQEKERQRMVAQQERERKKDLERLEKARAAEERKRETERRRQEKEAEKEKEREQRKREKEMKRALEAQEKAALKAQQRAAGIGQVDDDELEWEQLTKARHEQGYGSDTGGPDGEGMDLVLPPFPPTEICLKKAFAAAIESVAPDVAMVWSFCTSFPELLGLWPSTTLEELLRALVEGSGSRILGEFHIALIRLALADMEESQGKGVMLQVEKNVDRAMYNAAHTLEEAWAWGFETDVWRAHLTALTWPEVLRQVAVAAGRGRRRPNSAIDGKPVVGEEGEDVVESPKPEAVEGADEEDEAAAEAAAAAAELELRLKRPARLKRGSLKACAWLVLTREGTEGLPVQDIAQRIEQEGLRDLSSCGADAAAVLADALAHDLLFERVAHGTFALASIISHCSKLEAATAGSDEPVELSLEVLDDDADEATEWEDEDEDEAGLAADELRSDTTEDWVLALEDGDYNDLGLEDRVKALTLLVQMAVDGPTLRARLETRMDESQKIRKQVQEDQKMEKRRKQAEAAAKAAEVAREAMKALEKQKVQLDIGPGDEGEGDTHQTGKDSIAEAAKKAMAEAETRIKREGDNPETQTAEAQGDLQRRKDRLDRLRCAEEATAIRFKPLGQDRRRNRYWRFVQSEGPLEDPTQGRIFVEDAVTGQWALIDSQEGAQILIDTLMQRGVREGALYKALKRYEGAIMSHLPSSPLQLPLIEEQTLAFEEARWLTTQSTNAMVAISKAGLPRPTASPLDASSGSARHLTKLKQDLADIELALPAEAMEPGVDREAWRDRLEAAGSAAELRACLGELEVSVVPTHLSPDFRLSPHLIKGAWIRCGKEVWRIPGQDEEPQFMQEYSAELSEPLEWLPPTVASVSLRLLSLDASLTFGSEGPARDVLAAYRFIQRPAPPMPMTVGADFHLMGHGHADREYVRFLFTVGDEERPLIFPEFPVQLIEDQPTPFELPADVILAQSFVPEPYKPSRLPAAAAGPSSKSGSKGGAKALAKKGSKGAQKSTGRGRGSKARGGAKAKAPPRKAAPASQLHAAADEDDEEQLKQKPSPAFANKYGNEYEYGSVDDEDEDDTQGNTPAGVTPMASDDEDEEPEEDKLYEESESPEISDMDSD